MKRGLLDEIDKPRATCNTLDILALTQESPTQYNRAVKDKQYRDRDWLYQHYVTEKYSGAEIAYLLVGCHPSTIYYWLKKHKIPVRTSSETQALKAEIQRKASDASERLDRAVGSFALSFERLCHSLRFGILSVLKAHGLQGAERITEILTGDLTAFPLQSTLRALIAETHELSEEESRIITSIFKRVVKLVEERNRIIHSAWSSDYKSIQDLLSDTFARYRPGYSKRGAKPALTKYSLAKIEKWTNEAENLQRLVWGLGLCLWQRERIKDRFKIDADGKAQFRPEQL